MAQQHDHLIGITTIGEKGQVVVPADIRDALRLKKGDKFIVLAKKGVITMIRPDNLETVADHLHDRLAAVKTVISKAKK